MDEIAKCQIILHFSGQEIPTRAYNGDDPRQQWHVSAT